MVLWRYPWRGGGGSVTPVLHDDTVVVRGLDAGTVAIRPEKRNGEWAVERVWESNDVSMYVSTPVVAEGMLFGLSHRNSGQLFALDVGSGKTLWLGTPRAAMNTAV